MLATLEYLADSGLNPTVSALKCGHSYLTTSGNVSEHSSGNAVDIAAINGIPIAGHQDPGGITEITVRRLMLLQGTMQPHQIISLLDLGGNTMALPDHWDHIHVGFHPLFGTNAKAGKEALAVLKPGQWNDLINRLKKIPNPVVPTDASKYSIPVKTAHGKRIGSATRDLPAWTSARRTSDARTRQPRPGRNSGPGHVRLRPVRVRVPAGTARTAATCTAAPRRASPRA